MIEFRKAKKDYKNIRVDLSLKLNMGEIVLLLGKNASGKSTSLKLLLGVNELDYGSIELDGERIKKTDKDKFGFVLQDSFFSEDFTPRQIASVLKHTYSKFDIGVFYHYLEKFELPKSKKIKTFSTGMVAKLKILAAICHKPEILILDEPTTGLDLLSRDEIIKLIRSLMNDDMIVIIASHLAKDFEKLCDRVVFIEDGRLIDQYDMDFVDSSLAKIKTDNQSLEKIEKEDILCIDHGEFATTYLIKNRDKYMDDSFIMEKADLDDLIRAVYRRRKS